MLASTNPLRLTAGTLAALTARQIDPCLEALEQLSMDQLRAIPGIGPKRIQEIAARLAERGSAIAATTESGADQLITPLRNAVAHLTVTTHEGREAIALVMTRDSRGQVHSIADLITAATGIQRITNTTIDAGTITAAKGYAQAERNRNSEKPYKR